MPAPASRLPPPRAAAPVGVRSRSSTSAASSTPRSRTGTARSRATTVRWALMYPDAYEVGLPNQGVADPLRGAQRARLDRRRAHLLGVAGHGGGDARARASRSSPSTRTARSAPSTCFGLQLLDRARLHQHAQRARPGRHPAARGRPHRRRPDRARRRPRGVQPRADRRLPRRRRARRRRGGRARDLRGGPRVEGRGRGPGGRDELLRRLAVSGGVYVPALLRRDVRRRRRHRGRRTQPSGHPVAGPQAHADGPRRLALPGQAAGAAGRDRARAVLRRDLPRLHPRLPVLPGRHDHPPGARALDRDHRRHGRERHPQVRLRGGRPAVAVAAPTTPRSARSPRAWPTATRAPTSRCRCRRPGSTPSTSRWPTSSPATAAAPA